MCNIREPIERLASGRLDTSLSFENKLSPGLGLTSARRALAHRFCKHTHPPFFISRAVGVEINDFAVAEPNPESFLHEHVSLFLLSKGRFAATSTSRCGLFLRQRASVIDKLSRFCEVNGRARLTGGLVVGSQFGPLKLEKTTTPVLPGSVSREWSKMQVICAYRTVTSLLGQKALVTAGRRGLCLTYLPNTGTHTLRHVVILSTLGLRDEKEL